MQKQNKKKMLTSFSCTSKIFFFKKKKETKECKLGARNGSKNLARGEDDKNNRRKGKLPRSSIRKKERDPKKKKKI
jgi:hypothetical protein